MLRFADQDEGNYDTYVRTRTELLENQMKRYKWEQDQLQHMKVGDTFDILPVQICRVKQFYFFDPGTIPPPVIMVQHVSFQYNKNTPLIYKDLDFGIDLDTRIALVGPNGAGKSTLLKLISGDVMPSNGLIRRHSHCKIGRYHQ
ncbi:unnamed protein product, partial [Gongylonema pulchrum]|uniref:ABC transporter domain-containing protein n=1 Tax=Gongylonema pulchrum TaxID=637853 RepID=A0A183EW77_9BILA